MKNLKYILTIILVTALGLVSCDEEAWLKEQPYSFYSPENSYSTPEGIDQAVVQLYENVATTLYRGNGEYNIAFMYTTDVGYDALATNHALNSWSDAINPETDAVSFFWKNMYSIIFNANTILNRIQEVEYNNEERRVQSIAEAKFFRAFAYKYLNRLYGGVPLVLEEISSPRRDFVRASNQEIIDQIIMDLTEAVVDLPNTDEVADGRITKGAANHLLSEIYIVNGEYNKAVAAATEVIDNSGYALMTSRFGSRISEPGDVYWDLFRRGNQNRGSGNTEGIWVMQYEYNVTGGGDGDQMPRFILPNYKNLKTDDGQNAFLGPMNQMGGRGIGWWAASDYMLNQVWASSANDMRNSQYNIIRDIQVNNPSSAYFGQMLIADGTISNYNNKYNRFWSALFVKAGPINNFPEEVIQDPATGVTTGSANHSFRDRYIMRLAETYLLRAEAYLMLGDQGNAAADINVVRDRSNADPVAAVDVDFDYILDERARELFLEEHRLLTLYRMNKQLERIRVHNPMYNGTYADNQILEHQNLWPIPASEIQKNTEAVLAQNPGYAGGE